jgi:hypothetical protein
MKSRIDRRIFMVHALLSGRAAGAIRQRKIARQTATAWPTEGIADLKSM